MSEQSKELYVLGKISGYYGIKGWLKIFSYTQPRENIVRYKTLKIKFSNSHPVNNSTDEWLDITLDNGKVHGKGVVAHFTGYDTRESAASLIDAELAVYRSNFKRALKNEYYWADLIGLTVVNLEEIELGKISSLIETAAHDVLVVRTVNNNDAGSELLIPFVMQHYIKNIDLDTAIMTVDWQTSWNDKD